MKTLSIGSKNNLLTLFMLSLVGFGCANTQSSNVKTSGLYVSYEAAGNSSNQLTARAVFTVGNAIGTYVTLSSGDTVTCNGVPLAPSNDSVFNSTHYTATLPYQVGGTYTFVFTRTGESPYSTSVTLPEPMVIAAPAEASTVHIGQSLSTSWTPGSTASDNVTLDLIKNTQGTPYRQNQSPDTGSQLIPASATQDALVNTTGTLTLKRERKGNVSSAFQGGNASATQTASVSLNFLN